MISFTNILDFWFQDPKKWFNGGDNFDVEIQDRFWNVYEAAISWNLDDWMNAPKSSLALILVLDQFSRNMFRWDFRSFEYDFKALYATKIALKKWFLDQLTWSEKTFLIMPLMHSESVVDQDLCLQLFEKLSKEDQQYEWNVKFAKLHKDIIVQFGRFPHRNTVLWRESTPEEIEFLKLHKWF